MQFAAIRASIDDGQYRRMPGHLLGGLILVTWITEVPGQGDADTLQLAVEAVSIFVEGGSPRNGSRTGESPYTFSTAQTFRAIFKRLALKHLIAPVAPSDWNHSQ